ncbi:TetR/AcrR family transcriptional regulator [Nocardioides stalactiti]|uniref:TetR/AcrR family transcriptional regulator n=1 Tax=Nocardioides stalactiti TaxID=2755356 RepID=UPI0028AFA5FE|nr:helix-turn-helix domain-containing protein [Nocardioides stalactiti]
MATGSKERYFEAAIDLLADRGPRSLTLNRLCEQVGLTTGSFYRHFASWAAFKEALLADWLRQRTLLPFAAAGERPDAFEAVNVLIGDACELPHRTEAALRSWSLADPDVAAVQATIDRIRVDSTMDALARLGGDPTRARHFAVMSQFVLIGFQQMRSEGDVEYLRWALCRVFEEFLDPGKHK